MTKTVMQDHATKIISPELGPATPTTAATFKYPEEPIIIRHEVPRLGGESCACDIRDADGLLRIVETQAADLVRLRRALLSALSRPPQPTRSTQDVAPSQPARSAQDLSVDVESTAFRPSSDGLIESRFLKECREFATDVILDVGANTGLFGESVRRLGYRGHLVSFEPLSQAHATLTAAASVDPLWDVVERCAVGASEGSAKINIAGNSHSSSLLPMLDRHRETAPESEYRGTEQCPVITLDAFIERTFSDPTTLFGLKIDTQGYEAEILAGLKRNHDRVKVILCEMSILPLYAHGPLMGELCHLLAELNYRCVALSPVSWDRGNGELLQVDGIFVKQA